MVKCERCGGDSKAHGGDSKAHGSDRPFEWSGSGTYPGPCPGCKGLGVVKYDVWVSLGWVYENLICEFDHWDICLLGLVYRDGERWLCECCDHCGRDVKYRLRYVVWNDECDEYIDDYRVAYKHWFYESGKRLWSYDGWDLSWFHDKWRGRNPIVDLAR